MGMISERFAELGPSCRHYDPRGGICSGEDCKIGHPIRNIVKAANGGDEMGMAYMLPCRPGPERKADCPSYDPKTDEEIAEQRADMDRAMNAFVERLPKIAAMRRKMVANRLETAKATCPWCEESDAFKLTCAVGYNNHVHGKCVSCGEGFME